MFRRRRKGPAAAAEAFVAWIRDEHDTDLTFDDAGLASVDELADRFKYLSGERRANLEAGIADFIAEVLNRRHGGTWDRDHGVSPHMTGWRSTSPAGLLRDFTMAGKTASPPRCA